MTWKQFKEWGDRVGIQDDDEINYMDFSYPNDDGSNLDIVFDPANENGIRAFHIY